MNGLVYYLVRGSVEKGGLVFPSELGENEQGESLGGFYLSEAGSKSLDTYLFYAVHGDRLVNIRLNRFQRSKSFYRAEVKHIGSFIFYAQRLKKRLDYVGSSKEHENFAVRQRLRPWRPHDLDAACKIHGFYFVGYSPERTPTQSE